MHDIGDGLAPQNHDHFAAEIIRPFLRGEVVWTVEHHGAFQMVYYAHHHGWDPFEREKYKASPYYQSRVDFCERWDQASFDSDYRSEPLSFFASMVREVFARKAYDPAVLQKGVVIGLPLVRFGKQRLSDRPGLFPDRQRSNAADSHRKFRAKSRRCSMVLKGIHYCPKGSH